MRRRCEQNPTRRGLILGLSAALAPVRAGAESSPRVVIHAEAGTVGLDRAAGRIANTLEERGFGTVEIRFVPVAIDTPSVRYFHVKDRLLAERVRSMLPAIEPAWRLRDFTCYRPLPRAGTVEVWLPTR